MTWAYAGWRETDDGNDPRRVERTLQSVQEVLTHHLVIERGRPLAVLGKPLDLATNFAGAVGGVAVVLRSNRTELDDMFAGVQFVGELAQMVTQGKGLVVRSLNKDHRICVVVEDTVLQDIESVVQLEACPAGREARYEEGGAMGTVLGLGGAMHFDAIPKMRKIRKGSRRGFRGCPERGPVWGSTFCIVPRFIEMSENVVYGKVNRNIRCNVRARVRVRVT